MNTLLLSTMFIAASYLQTSDEIENVILKKNTPSIFHKISKDAVYLSAGIAFESASIIARLGYGVLLLTPLASKEGNECLLLSELCGRLSHYAFNQLFKNFSSSENLPLFKGIPPSQYSWYLNQELLTHIPFFSDEQEKLLLFLEERWLAKSSGFLSPVIDWIYPCFGVSFQVHPKTDGSYARMPSSKFSLTYQNREKAWKKSLPHPLEFPLILTRPYSLQEHLPSYLIVPRDENIQLTLKKAALKIQSNHSKTIIDLSHVVSIDKKNRKTWIENWKVYRNSFIQACREHNIDLDKVICIHRLQQEEIGGIRLLPITSSSSKDHQFLINWVSTFGLSANRIELDRHPLSSKTSLRKPKNPPLFFESPSKEKFSTYLLSLEPLQKPLMIQGTILVLKGLLENVSEQKWNEITNCPTRSAIVQLSFLNIVKEFNLLNQTLAKITFFDNASHIEKIHANISALLEIFSPFTSNDFPSIYQNLLTCIPTPLKSFTSYGVHTSGMTSLGGILKAVEKSTKTIPRVLYGENTYFECINASKILSQAVSIDEATSDDWKEVDLILAQFNPALKRVDLPPSTYIEEPIIESLHKALNARKEKPLTLALDCTLDFINSSKVESLLNEFQQEIEKGLLNIICYRSGLKFDLFGMDNYAGAPFFMIHNQDSKWNFFQSLLKDPALQTDRLSLNWFCLAYQNAALQLDMYRKQIFDNTRDLLNKVPSRLLYGENTPYHIVPIKEEIDPAFIDIRVSGPFHQLRAAALVAGTHSINCLEKGHPIFYRVTLGLYHPNLTIIFNEKQSVIRLTLGIDPSQVDILQKSFEEIDKLNGS